MIDVKILAEENILTDKTPAEVRSVLKKVPDEKSSEKWIYIVNCNFLGVSYRLKLYICFDNGKVKEYCLSI